MADASNAPAPPPDSAAKAHQRNLKLAVVIFLSVLTFLLVFMTAWGWNSAVTRSLSRSELGIKAFWFYAAGMLVLTVTSGIVIAILVDKLGVKTPLGFETVIANASTIREDIDRAEKERAEERRRQLRMMVASSSPAPAPAPSPSPAPSSARPDLPLLMSPGVGS